MTRVKYQSNSSFKPKKSPTIVLLLFSAFILTGVFLYASYSKQQSFNNYETKSQREDLTQETQPGKLPAENEQKAPAASITGSSSTSSQTSSRQDTNSQTNTTLDKKQGARVQSSTSSGKAQEKRRQAHSILCSIGFCR